MNGAIELREGGRLWKLVNYAILQGAWFGCVLGAAADALWVAWLSGATALALHLALLRDWRSDRIVVGAALAIGAVTDTIVRGVGAFDAPSDPLPAPFPVTWLLLLWAVFGTSIRHCMGWLRGRYVVAAVFGAVGGPLSLMGGARLGAVTLATDTRLVWFAIGLQWAVAMPLLAFVGERVSPATSPSSLRAR
ncbi:MAG: DUF2878 domain-containing protein [Planctomycetes bacterium]|nr:DUF2878 domain-containing protein [Planctomycetota bacterium]